MKRQEESSDSQRDGDVTGESSGNRIPLQQSESSTTPVPATNDPIQLPPAVLTQLIELIRHPQVYQLLPGALQGVNTHLPSLPAPLPTQLSPEAALTELSNITHAFQQASQVKQMLDRYVALNQIDQMTALQLQLQLTQTLEQRRLYLTSYFQSQSAGAASSLPLVNAPPTALSPSLMGPLGSFIGNATLPIAAANFNSLNQTTDPPPPVSEIILHQHHYHLRMEYQGDPFPIRLHKILDTAESKGYSDIIHWNHNSRLGGDSSSFTIESPTRFMMEVAPRYFRNRSFQSFVRQLNLYGFQKTAWGSQVPTYRHDDFRRGKLNDAKKIKRRVGVTAGNNSSGNVSNGNRNNRRKT